MSMDAGVTISFLDEKKCFITSKHTSCCEIFKQPANTNYIQLCFGVVEKDDSCPECHEDSSDEYEDSSKDDEDDIEEEEDSDDDDEDNFADEK